MKETLSSRRELRSRRHVQRRLDGHVKIYIRNLLVAILLSAVTYVAPILTAEASPLVGKIVSVILVVAFSAWLMISKPLTYLSYWLMVVLTQAWWTGVTSQVFSSSPDLIVTESKTLSIVVAVIVASPTIVHYLRHRRSVAITLMIYLGVVATAIRDLSPSTIAYGRNFIVPFLIFLVAIACTRNISDHERVFFLKNTINITLVLLAIGTTAEHIVGTIRWREVVNAGNQASLESLSTWTNFFGIRFERVGGLMVEPVTSGYVAGGALVLALLVVATSKARSKLDYVVLAAQMATGAYVLVSAATKASLLMVAIAVLAYLLAVIAPRRLNAIYVIVGSWVITLAAILAYLGLDRGFNRVAELWQNPMALIGGDSTAIHLAGLVFGFKSGLSTVIGSGLGVGGNFQRNFADSSDKIDFTAWLSSGSESGIGVVIFQLGIVGLLALVALLVVIGNEWGRSATVLLAVWSATSLLAESMMGPLVASLFFVGAALLREDTRLKAQNLKGVSCRDDMDA